MGRVEDSLCRLAQTWKGTFKMEHAKQLRGMRVRNLWALLPLILVIGLDIGELLIEGPMEGASSPCSLLAVVVQWMVWLVHIALCNQARCWGKLCQTWRKDSSEENPDCNNQNPKSLQLKGLGWSGTLASWTCHRLIQSFHAEGGSMQVNSQAIAVEGSRCCRCAPWGCWTHSNWVTLSSPLGCNKHCCTSTLELIHGS